ncbi:MAG: MFS transporter, partial [Rhodospirillales bacterium]
MAFALVGSGHTMSHIYMLTLPPLFFLIKEDLGVSYAALGLLVTVFHVATGVCQIPSGILVDRMGARVTLTT